MARWNIPISEEADRSVRSFLSRQGMKRADLSAFVERACRLEVLRSTMAEIQEQNADLSEEEALKLASEAVGFARDAQLPG